MNYNDFQNLSTSLFAGNRFNVTKEFISILPGVQLCCIRRFFWKLCKFALFIVNPLEFLEYFLIDQLIDLISDRVQFTDMMQMAHKFAPQLRQIMEMWLKLKIFNSFKYLAKH